MEDLKKKIANFREWQKTPYKFEITEGEECTCAACGTKFVGQFCPNCGQPANVGRYSYKKVVENFLKRWAIGDRSFFRTLRDLLLRPGYAVRDYLHGQQTAYYPPFNLLLLMAAMKLITGRWAHFDLANSLMKIIDEGKDSISVAGTKYMAEHLGWTLFYLLIITTVFIFIFFSKSPNFEKKMRFSEVLVTLTYFSCVMLCCFIVSDILSVLSGGLISLYSFVWWILFPVYLGATWHQVSGYSRKKTIALLIPAIVLSFIGLFFFYIVAVGFVGAAITG